MQQHKRIAKQKGQVLVFASLFLVAAILATFSIFDSSQLNTDRLRLQNGADAAAFTAATFQSRELNFHAFTNRAMVANQVSIAQMVSLSSYIQQSYEMILWLRGAGNLLQFIPYVGQLIKKVIDAIEEVNFQGNKWLQKILNKTVKLVDLVVIGGLSQAQDAYHYATLGQLVVDLQNVVAKNHPGKGVDGYIQASNFFTAKDIKDWANYVHRYEVEKAEKGYGKSSKPICKPGQNPYGNYGQKTCIKKDEHWDQAAEHSKRLNEFRAVTLESRDSFSKNRSNVFWKPAGAFKFVGLLLDFETRQFGGSELGRVEGKKAPYYAWSARDSVSFWNRSWVSSGWWWRKKWSEVFPFGMGRQATQYKSEKLDWENPVDGTTGATTYSNTNDKKKYWGGAWKNSMSSGIADGRDEYFNGRSFQAFDKVRQVAWYLNTKYKKDGFGKADGLRDFYDIGEQGIIENAMPIRIMLSMDQKKSKTIDEIDGLGKKEGLFSFRTSSNEDDFKPPMVVLSKAETYFAKAHDLWPRKKKSGHNVYEYGNLYSPYWQPRLVQESSTERSKAWVAAQLSNFF